MGDTEVHLPVPADSARRVAGVPDIGRRFCLREALWRSRVCEQGLEGAAERLDGRAFRIVDGDITCLFSLSLSSRCQNVQVGPCQSSAGSE